MRIPKTLLLRVLPWLLAVAVWWLITLPGGIDPLFLSSPKATLGSFVEGIRSRELLLATAATVKRVLSGLGIATVAGVAIGLLLGGYRPVRNSLGPFVDGIRSMPATALFPAFLIAFGVGDAAKIAVAAFVCTWAIAIVTADAVATTGATKQFLLRLHGTSTLQRFVDGFLMPALPSVLGAVRAAAGLALVVTVAVEMIVGTKVGLGQTIYEAQVTYRISLMYAAIGMSALAGVVLNLGLKAVGVSVLHWRER